MPKTLLLAVAGPRGRSLGSRGSTSFVGRGGSIGRAADCDWVLSALGVSRVHATIRFLNGVHFLEDRSTNGILLNGADLVKGEPAALQHGDRLQIDSFEVEVSLADHGDGAGEVCTGAASVAARSSITGALDPLAGDEESAAAAVASLPAGLSGGRGTAWSDGALDPLLLFDAPASYLSASNWNRSPGMHDHFRPPRPVARAAPLPENWDLSVASFWPVPAVGTDSAPAGVASIATPAAGELDRIFRTVVGGIMEVLRARAELKNSLRLPVTVIQSTANNPLKFAATPEEALQKIMLPQGAAFLSGSAAFEDAFEDLGCHEMAMLAAMRAAFAGLLAHFNPDRLEREAGYAPRRPGFAGKGRCWARYREMFENLTQDPEKCFRHLFGEEFARAYEAQLVRLKSGRRRQARNC